MPTWLAALVAVATVIAVYVFCIRPMRRGACAIGRPQHNPERARQIAELREELRVAEDVRASGPLPNDPPRAGSDS